MRGSSTALRERKRSARDSNRAHKQGRSHCRPESPGTYRRRRPPVRRRPPAHVPHTASHQEPIRFHGRTRHLRNDTARAAGSRQSLRTAYVNHFGRPLGCKCRSDSRRHAPISYRGAGIGKHSCLRHPAALGYRIRCQTHEHAAGRT